MQRSLFRALVSVVLGVLALPIVLQGALPELAAPVRLMRTPDAGLQPQAVMDEQGSLHLVFLKGDPKSCNVFYARRERGQAGFSTSLRVNSRDGGAVAIGTVRGAQLAIGRNDRAYVVWNGSGQGKANSTGGAPLFYSRLNESITAFEPQRNLMTSTIHLDGGGSVAADKEGNVYVIWHGHGRSAVQDEAHRAVFIARSSDDGRTFGAEQAANPEPTGACSCCGLKALADCRGRLLVLYRSATSDGKRDVTLLVSKDHGKTFQSKVLGALARRHVPNEHHGARSGAREHSAGDVGNRRPRVSRVDFIRWPGA